MSRSKQKWIDVSKKLPEDNDIYLVVEPTLLVNKGATVRRIHIAFFAPNMAFIDRFAFEGENRPGWYYYDEGTKYECFPTHWMELPELPELPAKTE